jgi:hypothetical protein
MCTACDPLLLAHEHWSADVNTTGSVVAQLARRKKLLLQDEEYCRRKFYLLARFVSFFFSSKLVVKNIQS